MLSFGAWMNPEPNTCCLCCTTEPHCGPAKSFYSVLVAGSAAPGGFKPSGIDYFVLQASDWRTVGGRGQETKEPPREIATL